MANVETWNTAAASNNSSAPDGAPEGWSSADVNNTIRECMAALARLYKGTGLYSSASNLQASMEWLDLSYGLTITRVSDTQITVGGADVTTYFKQGRRIRILTGAAQADGYVSSDATYSAPDTTINVTMDGATVPASPTKLLAFAAASVKSSAFYSLDDVFRDLRNRIINGDFRVWQRGTSFTASGYTADRWKATLGTGGAATISRQAFTVGQTDVPGEPRYWLRWAHTTNSSSEPKLEQRIEGVRTLAGQQVTVSFYAKAGASLNVAGVLAQSFGTGGSPSADVDASLGTFAVTTSWARYTATVTLGSISGKTLGTGEDDYLSLRLEMPTGATFTLDVADVQVEPGNVVGDFDRRPLSLETMLCQRYYEQTYPETVAPATTSGSFAYAIPVLTTGVGTGWVAPWHFKATKRAIPTITFYSAFTGTAAKVYGTVDGDLDASTTIAATTSVSKDRASLTNSAATGATAQYLMFQATADAEL